VERSNKYHSCWVKKETRKSLPAHAEVTASNGGFSRGFVTGHRGRRGGRASLLDIHASLPTRDGSLWENANVRPLLLISLFEYWWQRQRGWESRKGNR